jgi:queuosine precursor transporter
LHFLCRNLLTGITLVVAHHHAGRASGRARSTRELVADRRRFNNPAITEQRADRAMRGHGQRPSAAHSDVRGPARSLGISYRLAMPDSDRAVASQLTLSRAQLVYLWLTVVFVASLLVADVLGVKLFRIPFGFAFSVPWQDASIDAIQHTCGMLTFPITFLITDLVNEFYGKRAARRIVWIGFAAGGFAFLVINVALAMPHWEVPFNIASQSFDDVFSSSRIMYVASLSAYLVGSFSDIAIFGWLKRLTGGKRVWLRATGSTVVSQAIDSFIVTWLAFSVARHALSSGVAAMPFDEVLKTAATGYLLKFAIALGLTPVIYLGRWVMRTRLGLVPLPVAPAP